jgi:hypothetical protein
MILNGRSGCSARSLFCSAGCEQLRYYVETELSDWRIAA